MLHVFECIFDDHNQYVLLIALVICVVGAFSALRLFREARGAEGLAKTAWVFLSSTVGASAIWCTHFIAMLAYRPEVAVAYNPFLTLLSLLLAEIGLFAGLWVAACKGCPATPVVGGAIVGGAIALMHYTGMLGYIVGGQVEWRRELVAASIVLAVSLGSLAISAQSGLLGKIALRWASPLLVVAVLSLHFTGMAALHIMPMVAPAPAPDFSGQALPLAVAGTSLLIVAIGSFVYLLDQQTRSDLNRRLAQLSLLDARSGLPNGEALHMELAARLEAARAGDCFMIVTTRFAGFEDIAERHGRSVADGVIELLVGRMFSYRRVGAFVARTGPAEFTSFGPIVSPEGLRARGEGIRAVLASSAVVDMIEVTMDPRIGVACYPVDGLQADALLSCSKLALERALLDPLEPVCIYEEPRDAAAARRHILATDLRGALDWHELEVFYQPQVWIEDRRIIGQEALIRWNHPVLGMVSPAEFIPIAERNGEILRIGDWVLRQACAVATHWPEEWRIAVNVSPLQLRQPDLPERVQHALDLSGLEPSRLEIELTESLFLEDRDNALQTMRRIRDLGVRLCLDDFGTGYSSLDVLRHIPFDKIKLDKSFVDDLESNAQSKAILQAILAMGRSLRIPILAEGVETERQLEILQAEGCNKAQGFLLGMPRPFEQPAGPMTYADLFAPRLPPYIQPSPWSAAA